MLLYIAYCIAYWIAYCIAYCITAGFQSPWAFKVLRKASACSPEDAHQAAWVTMTQWRNDTVAE